MSAGEREAVSQSKCNSKGHIKNPYNMQLQRQSSNNKNSNNSMETSNINIVARAAAMDAAALLLLSLLLSRMVASAILISRMNNPWITMHFMCRYYGFATWAGERLNAREKQTNRERENIECNEERNAQGLRAKALAKLPKTKQSDTNWNEQQSCFVL